MPHHTQLAIQAGGMARGVGWWAGGRQLQGGGGRRHDTPALPVRATAPHRQKDHDASCRPSGTITPLLREGKDGQPSAAVLNVNGVRGWWGGGPY
jgi:hypothetical protein